MRHTRMITALIGAPVLMAVTVLPGAASAHWGHDEPLTVLQTDISSPKGLAVTPERDLLVAQGAFGPPGPVEVFDITGADAGAITPVTDPMNLVDVAVSPKDGTGWGITSDGNLLHRLADDSIVTVRNIPEYQGGDPDPYDQDQPPFPTESNPYGLTIARNGDALVVDAAGNDLIRFTPDGVGTTMALFDTESLPTEGVPPEALPPDTVLPPFIDAEAVPTTVTVGPDGYIYVGELKGFPFTLGSSHVWRIKPNAVGALCSVTAPDRACRVYSDGYTAIQDIAFDKFGRLYVYELAAEGVFAYEGGLETGDTPPAVLLQVTKFFHHENRTELAAGLLNQPGGIVAVGTDVYVTDGVFSVGRLSKVGTH